VSLRSGPSHKTEMLSQVLYVYLIVFFPEIVRVTLKTMFIVVLIVSFIALTRIGLSFPDRNIIPLIPYAIIPVIIRTFYDTRLAIFVMMIASALLSFFVPGSSETGFMMFLSGFAAIFSLVNYHRRGKFFITAIAVIITCSVLHTSLALLNHGSLKSVSLSNYLAFIINGLLLLLSYPIIFVFENRFKFLSDTTLLELANTSQPLLRKMAEEAPGSFQHSMQVANLAEEAARITGANPLLARAGALYHDIGKISSPIHFSENQNNNINPHEELNPEESAKIIIRHIESGIVLAKNFKIPGQIIDFIKTHHGTSVAWYFYRKYTDMEPWDTAREKEFSYPGPKPFSKETAIVMMADAIEAASRSLSSLTEKSIDELVERIVLLQEQDGQYSDVPFTYKDISDIKETFKKRLTTIYHVRVAYPEREGLNLGVDNTVI
ncbi:MAG TPA: HDIG domain-containing protein, partial [Bacteroidales bacterium]|nr:HDIG domain-containing protein [Bacteroidales bacterium]